MNEIAAKAITDILKVLANPTRLRIAEVLQDGELCVGELVRKLKVKEPFASQQLNKMKNKGILGSRRCGSKVFYYLKDKRMINKLLACMIKNYKHKIT